MEIAELLKNLNIPTMKRYVSVRPVEGEFMHRWVKDHGLTRTLEVGLAFGASACCIMSAHRSRHTCIDPFQKEHRDRRGSGPQSLDRLVQQDRAYDHPAPSA